ncbi:cytosine permease [Streptomyces sp. XD-27]|uniref:purine-cytosine permease family protein n=1 Tax=Streptomyces sp. XD-27 TaxID=3062779 RepID=UPI0026F446D3|nr:cytosine permease [Streptomyces sp. XD-27]WKX72833.1 cytosine permease [Streptomyces sp. XD-27]
MDHATAPATADATAPASSSEEGAIETRGIEPVPEHERHGRARELFPTWVAANISVLLLTMGAGLVVFNGLSLWQVLLVGVCASAVSYGMVGVVSLAGKWGGAPGLMLSRATFGVRGNYFPGMILWIARFGWETINAVTGAYAMLTVLDLLFGIESNTPLIVVTLFAFVACTFLVSGMGRKVLAVCNKWSTYLFGAFSVLVLGYLIANVDWDKVFSRPSGSTSMLIAGIGTIAAGGISWIPSGPDFTRYLPGNTSSRAIVGTTVSGAAVVVVPMVLMGAVMAAVTPDLASAPDPVSFLGDVLPKWLAVPYLITALVGMLLINSLSMYSAGFTAQTMGVKLPRAMAVSINAIISLVGGLILMLVAESFLSSFITFLTLLAVSFSAWIGVFLVDMARRRGLAVKYDADALTDTGRGGRYWYVGGFCWQAMAAWLVALATGLCFTKVDWFTGPLADTWLGRNGLGWAVTIVIAAAVFAVLPKPRENAPAGAAADREPVSQV